MSAQLARSESEVLIYWRFGTKRSHALPRSVACPRVGWGGIEVEVGEARPAGGPNFFRRSSRLADGLELAGYGCLPAIVGLSFWRDRLPIRCRGGSGRQQLPIFTTDIKRTDVLKLHQRMSATPKVANYAVIVGKAAVNFGIRQGLLPLDSHNPFSSVELYGAEGRERFLSEPELVRIGEALADLEATTAVSPWAAAALRLLIFTGARSDEILTLEWAWVNFERSAPTGGATF